MIVSEYPKHIKRLLREYNTAAHEQELHRELGKLDQSFAEWRSGALSSGELSHRVHQFETGPSRELFNRYNSGQADLNVAYAIVTGILDGSQMPPELIEALSAPLDFFRSLKERGELREPG
jgi:hypothetical protein